jgi:hypothetical protein
MNTITIAPVLRISAAGLFVLSVVGDIRFVRLRSTLQGGLPVSQPLQFQPKLSDFLIKVFPLFERRGFGLDRSVKTGRKLSRVLRVIRGVFVQVHLDR